jgi:hypothetical protein
MAIYTTADTWKSPNPFKIGTIIVSGGNEHGATRLNVTIILTLLLNILLACMITTKLVLARKAALVMVNMKGQASQYLTTINAVVESAAIWVVSIILYLANFIAGLHDVRSHHNIEIRLWYFSFSAFVLDITSVNN